TSFGTVTDTEPGLASVPTAAADGLGTRTPEPIRIPVPAAFALGKTVATLPGLKAMPAAAADGLGSREDPVPVTTIVPRAESSGTGKATFPAPVLVGGGGGGPWLPAAAMIFCHWVMVGPAWATVSVPLVSGNVQTLPAVLFH